ncbi:metallophosphoesterase [Acidiferrobacter sp.]|uniref:metallophosphoesterase n=1 Tax=Acidiferrobacter sp. TaxID=1872107 RepID=UPI00263372A3|nr:metallophosphoesterase [Acidiferrobacter sp.]
MKLHVLSDLHNEFGVFRVPKTDADVVILAGDIHIGVEGVLWARRVFADKDVIYIPGNHEFYHHHLSKTLLAMKEEARGSRIHVLDNDALVIGSVRFLGATLWTDFALFGKDRAATALGAVKHALSDFNYNIRYGNERASGYFTPEQSLILHRESVRWLRERLAEPFPGPTVVVTHHAPARGSVAPPYAHDIVSAGFASDLTDLMGPMDLWIHGHTHDSFDYRIRGTRVVCNPRGYVQHHAPENRQFDPSLVIELGPAATRTSG